MTWRLDPTETGLLIIDVQERLTPVIWEAPRMIKAVVTAIGVAHLFKLPIFLTEQLPHKLGPTLAPIRAALGNNNPPARVKAVISAAPSFELGELPPTLLAVGIETHVCVRQTVFDLRERGHEVRVLADAVSSRAELNHRLALHELREIAGARITTVETFAWELLERAEGDTFKALLTLLK
jgi:nicotinamidase-related amidase